MGQGVPGQDGLAHWSGLAHTAGQVAHSWLGAAPAEVNPAHNEWCLASASYFAGKLVPPADCASGHLKQTHLPTREAATGTAAAVDPIVEVAKDILIWAMGLVSEATSSLASC